MTCLFITLIFNLLSCSDTNIEEMPKIKEIWIYDYFHPRGYTTASAYGQFKELEEKKVSKFSLDRYSVDSIYCLMTQSKTKKIVQRKTGQNLLFAEIITNDDKILKIVIGHSLITDYTDGKDYWIKDEKHQKWLSEFRDRIVTEHTE